MIKVAEIERIRWPHLREGVSVRALAAEFGRSRRTIRRALADPGPWNTGGSGATLRSVSRPSSRRGLAWGVRASVI